MSLKDRVAVIPRTLWRDSRGALLKVLAGGEPHLGREVGEAYLVWAEPGQVRGGHYHPLTNEYFTLVEGQCQLLLADPVSGERGQFLLSASEPCTVCVPKGIAHAFANGVGAPRFLLVAYADRPYDANDTVLFDCSPAAPDL